MKYNAMQKMNKYSSKIILFISILLIVGCGENIDPSTLSPEQLAFYNPERPRSDRRQDEDRKAEHILTLAAVEPGMRVADLDAGNGYYTELFSSLVGPNGSVYLQNSNRYVEFSSEEIDERLEDNRLPNMIRIDSSFNNLMLPDELDLIFISLAFHDIYVPQIQEAWNADTSVYLSQITEALSEGGRLLIIDHSARPGTGFDEAASLHRIDEEFIQDLFESLGFELTATSNELRNPADDRTLNVFDDGIRGETDKFLLVFTKI